MKALTDMKKTLDKDFLITKKTAYDLKFEKIIGVQFEVEYRGENFNNYCSQKIINSFTQKDCENIKAFAKIIDTKILIEKYLIANNIFNCEVVVECPVPYDISSKEAEYKLFYKEEDFDCYNCQNILIIINQNRCSDIQDFIEAVDRKKEIEEFFKNAREKFNFYYDELYVEFTKARAFLEFPIKATNFNSFEICSKDNVFSDYFEKATIEIFKEKDYEILKVFVEAVRIKEELAKYLKNSDLNKNGYLNFQCPFFIKIEKNQDVFNLKLFYKGKDFDDYSDKNFLATMNYFDYNSVKEFIQTID